MKLKEILNENTVPFDIEKFKKNALKDWTKKIKTNDQDSKNVKTDENSIRKIYQGEVIYTYVEFFDDHLVAYEPMAVGELNLPYIPDELQFIRNIQTAAKKLNINFLKNLKGLRDSVHLNNAVGEDFSDEEKDLLSIFNFSKRFGHSSREAFSTLNINHLNSGNVKINDYIFIFDSRDINRKSNKLTVHETRVCNINNNGTVEVDYPNIYDDASVVDIDMFKDEKSAKIALAFIKFSTGYLKINIDKPRDKWTKSQNKDYLDTVSSFRNTKLENKEIIDNLLKMI